MRMRPLRTLLVALLCACASTPVAHSSIADDQALAARYSPIVRLSAQPLPCGPGEPYLPMDVDALFGEPTVALRGPWNRTDLVKVGPSADDLARGLWEYHLDFPGNPLDPGCVYEEWARRLTEGRKPTAYAHVASDPEYPGTIALQYWLFYAFNDYNNKHEGDWEMIQLVFDASDAAAALKTTPVEVGYSQHEGAERADWGDEKLEIVDETHPVVYPAAGSHANKFEAALYLGSSSSQGVGCDDTTGPHIDVLPTIVTIPSDATTARRAFPWIAFEGRWGELQIAFYNGPTGPNLKEQWTRPIAWASDWRDRSYAIPAGGLLGTGATDFFCGAVAHGSNALRRVVDAPWPALLAFGVLLACLAYLLSRTRWRPAAPLRLARRRTWGQTLAASARMYVSRPGLFLGIGFVVLPISVLITALQALVFHASSVAGVENGGEGGGLLVTVFVGIGATLTLLTLVLVQAATAHAVSEIDAGRGVSVLDAYRGGLRRWPSLLGALLIAAVVVTALSASLLLIPVAVWLAVRWALLAQSVVLDGRSTFGALHRSGQLVKRGWFKVASLVVVAAAIAIGVGPLLGAVLIILTSVPFAFLNVVAGIVYAVAMPFVALTTTYVYFDARVREHLAPDRELSGPLPSELPEQGLDASRA